MKQEKGYFPSDEMNPNLQIFPYKKASLDEQTKSTQLDKKLNNTEKLL